eukprot:Gb_33517 [translate_table: standard]
MSLLPIGIIEMIIIAWFYELLLIVICVSWMFLLVGMDMVLLMMHVY